MTKRRARGSRTAGKLAPLLEMPVDIWFEVRSFELFMPLGNAHEAVDRVTSHAEGPAAPEPDIEALPLDVHAPGAETPLGSRAAQRRPA